MKRIRSISTMCIGEKDYGYLIAVCEDGTVWTRVFPEARGDSWREIEAIGSMVRSTMDSEISDSVTQVRKVV